ncbi:MAG: hypothetical protein A4E36_00776 [Methanoregulaceae archaeon PtaB.Bin009]|nr:MAG: hypothetical protein A4E36_00776 [Methanoregulaceae archaeon PtaB.Bin009]
MNVMVSEVFDRPIRMSPEGMISVLIIPVGYPAFRAAFRTRSFVPMSPVVMIITGFS